MHSRGEVIRQRLGAGASAKVAGQSNGFRAFTARKAYPAWSLTIKQCVVGYHQISKVLQ